MYDKFNMNFTSSKLKNAFKIATTPRRSFTQAMFVKCNLTQIAKINESDNFSRIEDAHKKRNGRSGTRAARCI